MSRSSHRRFVVHGILSAVAMGRAERGRITDSGLVDAPHPTSHSLIDGDYLALKLQVPEDHRPVSVGLARVTWAQGSRFGVELLMMDADERARLNGFLEEHLPLELEFQDPQEELTSTAAE